MDLPKKLPEQATVTADSKSLGKVDWFGNTFVDAEKLFALESTHKALEQVMRIEDAAGRKQRR